MKRLHIIAEGQTEENFVNTILKPYLSNFNVFVDARCVYTSKEKQKIYRGGMTTYLKAKQDITLWLKQEKNKTDVCFTTMFDLYALPKDFPKFQESKIHTNPYDRIVALENAFAEDINDRRFIPCIQLHEFEALLLSKPKQFAEEYFDNLKGVDKLIKLMTEQQNPELINDKKETAPSKRIIAQFADYENNKVTVGARVANNIGIAYLKENCTHFREWVEKLERLG